MTFYQDSEQAMQTFPKFMWSFLGTFDNSIALLIAAVFSLWGELSYL